MSCTPHSQSTSSQLPYEAVLPFRIFNVPAWLSAWCHQPTNPSTRHLRADKRLLWRLRCQCTRVTHCCHLPPTTQRLVLPSGPPSVYGQAGACYGGCIVAAQVAHQCRHLLYPHEALCGLVSQQHIIDHFLLHRGNHRNSVYFSRCSQLRCTPAWLDASGYKTQIHNACGSTRLCSAQLLPPPREISFRATRIASPCRAPL